MISRIDSTAITCPFCARLLSLYSGSEVCPHCQRRVLGVACPACDKPSLNLTHIQRYGKVTCFCCHASYDHLPDSLREPAGDSVSPRRRFSPTPAVIVTPQAPKTPALPVLPQARLVLVEYLLGLERALEERESLRTPDLRLVVTCYLDSLHAALALDDRLERGEVTAPWLHAPAQLDQVVQAYFRPSWPAAGVLLPDTLQAWLLAADHAARQWQCARRHWLAERCGLTMMPIIPAVTTANPCWMEIDGEGAVVTRVLAPGFLLGGEVLRKARVAC
jgi:hypothetical protein